VARKTIGQPVDRFEPVVQLLAEGRVSLQKLIADLARETGKGFDRVAKQFEETDKRIDKLVTAKRETDKKFDERVDQLVIAIRELIRQQNTRKWKRTGRLPNVT
jgi:hypothetical protein